MNYYEILFTCRSPLSYRNIYIYILNDYVLYVFHNTDKHNAVFLLESDYYQFYGDKIYVNNVYTENINDILSDDSELFIVKMMCDVDESASYIRFVNYNDLDLEVKRLKLK